MNDFTKLLDEIVAGHSSLAPARDWLEQQLKKPDCDPAALLACLEQAQQSGLPRPVADALRRQIETAGAAPPTLAGADVVSATSAQTPPPAAEALRVAAASVGNDTEDFDPFAAHASGAAVTAGETLSAAPGAPQLPTLNGRYALLMRLRRDALGDLYRGRDLSGAESAQVVVRLLPPEATQPGVFAALQLLTHATRQLAHPNIATVLDFGRDGDRVYLVTEFLDGRDLRGELRHPRPRRLHRKRALDIIRQMSAGLEEAHEHGVTHGDLKPENVFLCRDGRVKLQNFGLTQALQHAQVLRNAPVSVYAAPEVLAGKPADPRDDIYALACLCCELLTGQHPYNRQSAAKVRQQNLRPTLPRTLGRHPRRALTQALALERADRPPTVQEYWETFQPRSHRVVYTIAIVAAIIAALLLGYLPALEYLHLRRDQALVSELAAGGADVPALLTQIRGFSDASQHRILARAAGGLSAYFESQAEASVDASRGHYDYPAALGNIATALQYDPDSKDLHSEKASLEFRRARFLAQLMRRFNAELASGTLTQHNSRDLAGILEPLRAADPGNGLLRDPRLIANFVTLTQQALNTGDTASATQIINAGLRYAPASAQLLDMRDNLAAITVARQNTMRVAQLETRLQAALPQLRTLADFEGMRDDMLALQTVAPNDAVLQKLKPLLGTALQSALTAAAGSQDWSGAETSLTRYAPLLDLQTILGQRQALLQTETSAGYVPANLTARLTRLNGQQTAIAQMLANPQPDADWDATLLAAMQSTAAQLQPGDLVWFTPLMSEAADAHIALVRELIQKNRFVTAKAVMQRGKNYAVDAAEFAPLEQLLNNAQQIFLQQRTQRIQQAGIATLQTLFQAELDSDDLAAAKQTYAGLQQQLAASDAFFTSTAPQAYALAYLRLAQLRAAAGDLRGAAALAQAGLRYAPLTALQQALRQYGGAPTPAGSGQGAQP